MDELSFYEGSHSGEEIDELLDAVPNKAEKTDLAATQQISALPLTSPATATVLAEKYVVYNNLLYITTDTITSGETSTSFMSKLQQVTEGGLNALKSELSDTGWITLNDTYPTQYRVRHGVVYINFRLSGGSIPTDGTVLGYMPSQYWPKQQDAAVCLQNGRGNIGCSHSDGGVSINSNPGQSFNAYMSGMIIYPL